MTTIDYLTAILVFVTSIYSYLTYKMAKASEASVQAVREQSEAMLRPYVSVSPYVRPHTTVLYLRIENTGRTSAENLQLSMDKDFFQFGEAKRPDHNLRTKAAFVDTIQSLPPGGSLVFALAQGFVIFAPGADVTVVPQQFSVTATHSFAGKQVIETHRIDLRPYIGSEGERDPVVDELEKLRKVAEEWK
ncbi:hypothetical protein OIN59_23665 [Acidovorax sp. D2M1]|uniref:Uncharacterized protein n=1 Tax=Acidovorax benzenivorans TaxID=2987520 RepID=A0ABT5S3B7_9BURK|nr:hypothetical protein [Acidovorax benzenivorans]MDD2180444.1 hypothetical protein [Acidovorax benzenivorans]